MPTFPSARRSDPTTGLDIWAEFGKAAERFDDALVLWDAAGAVAAMNAAAAQLLGALAEPSLADLFAADVRDAVDPDVPRRSRHVVDTPIGAVVLDAETRRVPDDGAFAAFTVLRRARVRRRQTAGQGIDEVTGLLDRRALLQHLADRCDAGTGSVTVLLGDIDRFKYVNESLGHEAGDEVLRRAARRIEGAVRPDDVVARIGGDEFAVVCSVDNPSDAAIIAGRIHGSFAEPMTVASLDLALSIAIGIVVRAPDDARAPTLLRDAEAAMYVAKDGGRNRSATFTDVLRDEAGRRLQLEIDLRDAVDDGLIEPAFQPIVDLDTEEVVGVEALMRWRRSGMLVTPDHYLDVAEDSGLILPMGDAIRLLSASRLTESDAPPVELHLNVSPTELGADSFWASMQRVLVELAAVDSPRVVVELTEHTIFRVGPADLDRLRDLKALGVAISLDDFGTGYSSLSHLRHLPVDQLKIDQTFVRNLTGGGSERRIVSAIISLAESLELECVAEGVEDRVQADILRELGCRRAQGHLFGRPSTSLPTSGTPTM